MAKVNRSSNKPLKKGKSKRGIALKRYNKILHIKVSDLKKKGIAYKLKEVRKEVSGIYPELKIYSVSQISKKKVFSASAVKVESKTEDTVIDGFLINAQEVPRYWFDKRMNWFDLIEWIPLFNQTYPEIPIVIKTANNELKIKGNIGEYSGSIFQDFINNKLREEFDNSYGEFLGIPAWQDEPNKTFAFWGTDNADLPDNTITDFEELEERTVLEIEKREQKLEEQLKDKKKQEKLQKSKEKKPKVEEPKEEPKEEKPKEKQKVKTKRQPTPLKDKNEAKKILLEEFKLGIWTKEEYREKANNIDNMYSTGGLI